jgi:hypothetical protein
MSVSMKPGTIMFTRMPREATSRARDFVKPAAASQSSRHQSGT